jgi:hypothetical protein
MNQQQRAVVRQALDALEDVDGIDTETECVTIDVGEAITALLQLLEQPEEDCPHGADSACKECHEAAQPAAQDKRLKVKLGSQYGCDLNGHWFYLQPADEFADAALHKHTGVAAPQPVQEPVAWRYTDARGHYRYRGYVPNFDVDYSILKPQALYTTPPAQPTGDSLSPIEMVRPQNCGTGYCSCIECHFKKGGA